MRTEFGSQKTRVIKLALRVVDIPFSARQFLVLLRLVFDLRHTRGIARHPDAVYLNIETLPVSGSTSTSQICVKKPGPAP